jgi:hypothetical protein
MRNFIEELTSIAMPKFSLIFEFFNKPIIGMIALIPTVAVVPVVDFYGAVCILGMLFVGDLITGILASYFTWKVKVDKVEKWFFGKGEGFSSDKFKKMFVKLMIYLGTPFVVQKFQETFRLHNFRYETISDAEFSIATLLIIVFCLNEGFSIFHENLPVCGFNLWERIKKMIGFYKEVKTEITE